MESIDNKYLDRKNSDSSGYIFDTPNNIAGIPSHDFSSIKLLYSSPNGVFRIFSANRYGKRFLLKSISDQYANDPIYNMILTKEFEIGMGLEHPNIRRTIGFENISGIGNAIILEYIDGETIDNALKAGRINQDNIRPVISQLIDAIGYLHSKQVYHRDIKPANILLTYSGSQVKLIDFSLSDTESYIVLKNPAGTRKYLAPEQLKSGAKPSAKSDIYSFGVVIKEIAEYLNDQDLLQLSKTCCDENPENRPDSMSRITLHPQKTSERKTGSGLDSAKMTYFLLTAILALSIVVGTLAYQKLLNNNNEVKQTIVDSTNVKIVDMQKYNLNRP